MYFFDLIAQLETSFLIQDFAVVMIVAAVMVFVTHKLKQPMVIGYLLAGMVIGPFTPPFSLIHEVGTINTLAEIGIIILLFVIGTEFPITKLRSVGRISMVVGIAESLGTLLVTFFVARTLGFSQFDSMFLALAMSVTSTVVTVKILEELNMINDKSSVLIMGILIVEDVIVITLLGILQSLALTAAVSFIDVLLSVGIVLGFIAAILILGSRYLPPVIDKLARTTDYSVLIIVILGLAFGLSFVAIELGLSPVIGAFLAGVLVAESNSAGIARVITIPLRDVFAALFFVSIGALVDVSKIPLFIIPALILIATSFIVKMMIIIPVLIRAGYDTTTAVRTGLGLSSARGEMSLIVGKGGQDVGAVSSYILPILGVVTIVTTFATPYILKMGTKLNISSAPGEDKKS